MGDSLRLLDMGPTLFDRTTAVRPAGGDSSPTTFLADLDPAWGSLLGLHGGYLTAIAVRAVEALVPDRAVRTVTTSFLRPSAVGPIEINLELIRSGRNLSTVGAHISQGERDIAVARVTLVADVEGSAWQTPVPDRPAPFADCLPFVGPEIIKHFAHAELRIDPATAQMGDGGPARVAGHVRPVELRPYDAAWLVMAGDWFPPSPFRRVAPPIGGVSIDYTVHVHRTLPAARDLWLEGVFATPDSVGGVAVEHGLLATPEGAVVAETFHTRWTG